MNVFMAVYFAILFFLLSPGIFLRLPQHGSKMTVATVHAIVFGLIAYLTGRFVWRLSHRLRMEGIDGEDTEEENKKKNDE
jgi:hypothetical protein